LHGDVVVVTINYRLGPFGFLHLADLFGDAFAGSGNLGICDQIAALQWVRDCIAAFGGDPHRVTVFGESAGGGSIGTLLGTPAAKGLFARAIPQSGAASWTSTAEQATDITTRLVERLGVKPGDADALLAASMDAVIEAVPSFAEGGVSALPFQPVVDGVVLPRPPLDAIAAGNAAGVHLVTGTNRHEMTLFHLADPTVATLDEAGVRATFFVLGWVAERHPGLVRDIQAAGHEIGCHSFWHRLVYRQTPAEFREDLRRARDVLEDLVGEPVIAYRAPSFSITRDSLWALDVLIDEGFLYDSSIYPTHHDRYGLPGAPPRPHRLVRAEGEIREFPLAVYRRLGYPLPVGGGGYFRLYPYALTRHGLRTINAEGRPFAVYLHPWEFDPDQPRLAPGRLGAFRHYVGLRRTEGRLARLLRDFAFGTLTEAFERLDGRGELTGWEPPLAA